MISSVKALYHERYFMFRLLTFLLSVWISGGLFGLSVQYGMTKWPLAKIDPHIFLASHVSIDNSGQDNNGAIIAVHSEKLLEIARQGQAAEDDRKQLHDEIAKVHDLEVTYYNDLSKRLSVDETKITTVIWVVGTIFALLNGIPTILSIIDFKEKRRITA